MDSWKDCGKEYDFNPETEHYRTETEAEVYLIKANLPASKEADKEGNGEGVFLQVDAETKKAYDTDERGGMYTGILDNDSTYFPALEHGTRVPLTMRGKNRPVIPYAWAINYATACAAWERGEQAQGKKPEEYPSKWEYLKAKMEFYEFIDEQEEPPIYDMKDWENAGTFSAKPGQQITAEVYEELLNTLPPLNLPRETARRALHSYGVPVHAGFLMGEPTSADREGPLYHAFGSNDYGKGPKYFYLGLSHREESLEGVYYFFDCMDGLIGDEPMKPEQVRKILTGEAGTYTEKELIRIAADHEATLYRQEYQGGDLIKETRIYNAWGLMERSGEQDPDADPGKA